MMIVKRKKSEYIYLYSGLFMIMRRDEIFNGDGNRKIFVPKKIYKGTRMRHFLSHMCIWGWDGFPIANPNLEKKN